MDKNKTNPDMLTDIPELNALFEHLGLSDLDRLTIDDLMRYAPDKSDIGLAAILGLLFAALSEGSLCLSFNRQDLLGMLGKGVYPHIEKRIVETLSLMENGVMDELVDRNAQGAFKPLVLDETTGRRLLYFQKFHYHEKRLKNRLNLMLTAQTENRPADGEAIQAIVDGLYSASRVIRKGKDKTPITRDSDQIGAIRAALTTPFLVVSGGPGTGKTSLLVNILRALVQTGTDPERIMLAAPTGRAAQRMTEALHANLSSVAELEPAERALFQLSGTTLHKLLVYRSSANGFVYGERLFLPARVIALDEVSMVDVVMMDHFFQAVDTKRTKVILIGDKDQLPSVEAGSVLADISGAKIMTMPGHLVQLRKVYRASGELLDLAKAINAGEPVNLDPCDFEDALERPAGQWSFVTAADEAGFNRHINQWTRHYYGMPPEAGGSSYVDRVKSITSMTIDDTERAEAIRQLLVFAGRSRILAVVRKGITGMQRINERIAGALKTVLDPMAGDQNRLFDGALIMITRNDYQKGLFNGDVGVILRQPNGGYQACFPRTEDIAVFPASGIADWDYAFAMTVHKSQGSEFDDTWLILPDDPDHRLLTREILYTAATRAARRLIVYGSEAAFKTALGRKIKRLSGF